jgi:beta-phosphoglucomutase-like phosphatase (HAD superfamily)
MSTSGEDLEQLRKEHAQTEAALAAARELVFARENELQRTRVALEIWRARHAVAVAAEHRALAENDRLKRPVAALSAERDAELETARDALDLWRARHAASVAAEHRALAENDRLRGQSRVLHAERIG